MSSVLLGGEVGDEQKISDPCCPECARLRAECERLKAECDYLKNELILQNQRHMSDRKERLFVQDYDGTFRINEAAFAVMDDHKWAIVTDILTNSPYVRKNDEETNRRHGSNADLEHRT